MSEVKRYWAAAVNDIETNPCLVRGWVPVHLSSDYDAALAKIETLKRALSEAQSTIHSLEYRASIAERQLAWSRIGLLDHESAIKAYAENPEIRDAKLEVIEFVKSLLIGTR